MINMLYMAVSEIACQYNQQHYEEYKHDDDLMALQGLYSGLIDFFQSYVHECVLPKNQEDKAWTWQRQKVDKHLAV